MTDDSAIEQRAVRLAFPRLHAGEQEVDHLLCSVYSNRTLLRRLGSKAHQPAYQLLKHAMYCFTGVKNRELCEQAIAAVDHETANYIRVYWLQTASKWAMYARQHSPFLLQTTTTNACEAWHRKLKSGAGLTKGQVASHGIYGMTLNIIDAANDVDSRAVVANLSRFRNRKLAVCTKQYPEIGRLPVPVQKLIAGELNAVEERIAKGKEVPVLEDLQCHCKFHRQYLLPCRHIFHLDTEVKVLTPIRWDAYIMMFGECGIAIYEAIDTVWVEHETDRGKGVNSFVLRLRDRMEQLQQKVYAIQEEMELLNIGETAQGATLKEWVGHVEETLDSLVSVSNREVINRHRPWEL